jgi:hypothetical protein
MPLSSGARLGPYEISAKVGAGGMGEEYSTQDSRLNRDFVIKVFAQQFTERFEREGALDRRAQTMARRLQSWPKEFDPNENVSHDQFLRLDTFHDRCPSGDRSGQWIPQGIRRTR